MNTTAAVNAAKASVFKIAGIAVQAGQSRHIAAEINHRSRNVCISDNAGAVAQSLTVGQHFTQIYSTEILDIATRRNNSRHGTGIGNNRGIFLKVTNDNIAVVNNQSALGNTPYFRSAKVIYRPGDIGVTQETAVPSQCNLPGIGIANLRHIFKRIRF